MYYIIMNNILYFLCFKAVLYVRIHDMVLENEESLIMR